MPKGLLPHFDDYVAYTMPLVIRVLENEYPARFSDIPEPFVGPLKVTLAQDLAIAARHVLFDGSRRRFREKRCAKLLRKYGGQEYVVRSEVRDYQLKQLDQIQIALVDTEQEGYLYFDYGVDEGPPNSVSMGACGVPIRWLDIDGPARDRIAELRGRMRDLLESVRLIKEEISRQEEGLKAIEQTVRCNPEFQQELASTKWRLAADFSSAIDWQEKGATHYLRNLESKWWYRFMTAFEEAVAADAAKPFRMALRDNLTIERIKKYIPGAKNWSHAAMKFFEANSGDWWEEAPSERSIESCRLELAHDDLFVLQWTKQHGRPRTFYAPWAYGIVKKAPADQYFAPSRLSVKWIETVQSLLPEAPLRDDEELRLNELQWVLSRGGTGPYQFEMYYGSDREKWRTHGQQWWSAIANAGGGSEFPADAEYFYR